MCVVDGKIKPGKVGGASELLLEIFRSRIIGTLVEEGVKKIDGL